MEHWKHRLKRLMDLAITIPAIVILTPIIGIIALTVRVKLGSPIFFLQERPGLNGSPTTIAKFRTMTNDTDEEGNLLPSAERLTPFGSFLRSTSLDELPELINVLRGEMSLVGPRPLLPEYLPHYTDEAYRRHDVLPGITGWAQVNGRNTLDWEEKFALDLWYVDNWSFWLDIKILFLTLMKVVCREDIIQPKDKMFKKFFEDYEQRSDSQNDNNTNNEE